MNYYQQKDANKFKHCNKLITRGVLGSSSHKYMDPTVLGLDPLVAVNTDTYTDIDVVGVSVNGARRNRVVFDKVLVALAINAGAYIVKDNTYNTNRSFNIGERELEAFLIELGATCKHNDNISSSWSLYK